MKLSKSKHLVAVHCDALMTIESLKLNEATGRPRYSSLVPVYTVSRHNKICQRCHQSKNGCGVFCRKCYFAIRRIIVTLRCGWCEKAFERSKYEYEKQFRRGFGERFFCSRVCMIAHRKATLTVRRLCLGCECPLSRPYAKLCEECRSGFRRVALDKAGVKRPLHPRFCEICGRFFQPLSHRTTYCSRQCANRAHSIRMKGSGNSHFRHGRSANGWFVAMRPLIKMRDGNQCVICGAVKSVDGRSLQVHHIDIHPTNNLPENLITLCSTCHIVHHKSAMTRWLWFDHYAAFANAFMTSKWKEIVISLQTDYSSTTA